MTRSRELAELATVYDQGSLSGRNRIINGDMRIDQRNSGVSGTASTYTVDRWFYYGSQEAKGTWSQNLGSATPPTGYANYLGFSSSGAYSILATDQFLLGQKIEGFNVADIAWGTTNAATVTLSFKVWSSLTGTFGGSLQNNAANRCYPFSYTVSTANTWTSISVVIPGDTTGTWLTSNGTGINVIFSLGTGSTYSGTAGAWTSSSFITSVTGAVSIVSTNGATFYITGVQLEKGSVATPFEYRPYGTELALCQRYYQIGSNRMVKQNCDTLRNSYDPINFMVFMRTAPTLGNTNTASTNVGNASAAIPSVNGFSFLWNSTSTIDFQNTFNWTASAEL